MRIRQTLTSLFLGALIFLPPGLAFAATGCSYPGSLDSFADKVTNDFLTVADVNKSNCAIEKLEAGPLRLDDGTAGAPSYAFRTSATAGMYLSAADEISFSTASTQRVVIDSAGALWLNSAKTVAALGNRDAAGEFIQRETVASMSPSANDFSMSRASTTDTYAVAFSNAPRVMPAGVVANEPTWFSIHNITTTGFSIEVISSGTTARLPLWVALGD